ncbi:zinc/manganese transport system ATP-binding protein [Saccharopolyspora erythraea NRRL 2338]|uniref:ABC transporter, ATP-binding protein n=2 Tax=Saccharopolyspora erythraea TaxID=1836 RepID=A4F6X6_SACEN|nr:metal ABC transporter ATP-binding protein [Saccharopolyspora erythraea]EQD85457.1 histidinol-phosphatase [Saccharopolyspora erythraea D]PFG93601.1 zinc/manganese transport system ATP-binding protein [Saccharopolyspora erythraea NRRL 2338]QRK90449.1 metal ABC transporter ATP-binding protein [Saccharopolyspora erythraea]CAL99800.1 ABC transporter, ATP-binding protein [Saccharopolyspora erythraea NRRL 2338]
MTAKPEAGHSGHDSTAVADRAPSRAPAVQLRGAQLSYGTRVLWDGLDLDVEPGEFLAVLGPNGSGKTSLLRVLLGLQPLSSGSVKVAGAPAHRGSARIGYIPQQRAVDATLTVRGRDLVGFGLDGHHWGMGIRQRRERRRRVDDALRAVDATAYAKMPLGLLSGGEQQRLRVAQALVSDPAVLLCDEPLLSLDIAHQRKVSRLISQQARDAGAAVLFVTHELNPVLPLVDRVLYLVGGRFRIGTPDEVMNSETLSELYGTRIEVARVGGRLVVSGVDEEGCHVHEAEQA